MKTVLITGASRGIGFELMKIALLNGAHVVAISRSNINTDGFDSTNLTHIKADLTHIYEENNELLDPLKAFKFDLVINNAGLTLNKSFDEITPKEYDNVYNTNVKAPFFLLQKVVSEHLYNQFLSIINVSSMGGVQGSVKFPGLSAYSSSKGALTILTECLAEEWKDLPIQINNLALGAVQTEMLEEAFPGYKAEISPVQMAQYIWSYALYSEKMQNGKTNQISVTTP